jgi:hypothetical protein
MIFGWEEVPEHHDHEADKQGTTSASSSGYRPVRNLADYQAMQSERSDS